MNSEKSIEINGLSRVFEVYEKPEGVKNSLRSFFKRNFKQKTALAPTNLKIEPGQIVGLVGANGAGKTTLLKLLSGLIYPTSGTAQVLGHIPWERNENFLKRISILLGQKNQLWWDISPMDSYALLTGIYDLDPERARQRVIDLSKLLDCHHVLNTQLRRLSLGERMKMEIIGALLHEPEVLFLDEPTIGLDVVAQDTIRNFLAKYVRERGPTVILTSHYMDDIARLANRLLLISHGSIVYDGSVDKFIARVESKKKLTAYVGGAGVTTSFDLPNGQRVNSGSKEIDILVTKKDLPATLQLLTTNLDLEDLKIEESDFEGIIKEFLEKESRLRPTSRSH